MDLNDRANSVKIQQSKEFKPNNPFLKCCGNFSTVLRNQIPKGRVLRKKTKITLAMFGTVMDKLRELPSESGDSEEDFVKKVIKGERRQLFSRFTFSKRSDELFLTMKSKAEFIKNRLTASNDIRQSQMVAQLKQYNTSFQEQRVENNLRNPEKEKPSPRKQPIKSPIKEKLPSISPQKVYKPNRKEHNQSASPDKQPKQKTQQISLNRPILSYNQKQLSHIKAQTYVVMQHPSMQTVLAHHPRQAVQIASLTKIMTFYVIVKIAQQRGINVSREMVEVHPHFEEVTGTSAELVEGDIYSIEQLLYGLMLPSGNDAAVCLADWAGRFLCNKTDIKETVKAFVVEMNRAAKAIGLKDTRYGNPHGLPHVESRSTAADVARLVSLCMNSRFFCDVINTKEYKITIKTTDGHTRFVEWQNTNKLLRRPGFIGVKTGITVTAGPCLSAGYVFRGKTYIVVLLRTNKISRRFKETRKILYWTLKNLFQVTPQQRQVLQALRRNRRDFDSDNSEDQQEFVYSNGSSSEYAKRNKILKYEL